MTVFITILIVIAALIVVLLIAAALGKNDYMIEENIVINRPQRQVFDYIRILRNAEHFSKWVMTDPAMKKEFRGTDGTIGFVYAWDSQNKQVGAGEQEIIGIVDDKSIVYKITFIRPFQSQSGAYIKAESLSENQTKASWVFSGKLNYSMKLLHLVLNLKKALAKDMHQSLVNLKNILEK